MVGCILLLRTHTKVDERIPQTLNLSCLKIKVFQFFFQVYSKHTKNRDKEKNKLEEKAIKSNTVTQFNKFYSNT